MFLMGRRLTGSWDHRLTTLGTESLLKASAGVVCSHRATVENLESFTHGAKEISRRGENNAERRLNVEDKTSCLHVEVRVSTSLRAICKTVEEDWCRALAERGMFPLLP